MTTHASAGVAELRDELTGFRARQQLTRDLELALLPESEAAVLAVFDLRGLSEFREHHGARAGNELVLRLAGAVEDAVGNAGSWYRSRQDEFCLLARGEIDGPEIGALLSESVGAARAAGAAESIEVDYGVCLLPDEAAEPVEALMLADERLLVREGSRPPRERRTSPRP